MIKIYLAEDQSLLNTALAQLLNLEDDFEVVGTASDGETALHEITILKPDIAVLDIEMPGASGLDVADVLQSPEFATKVIILTTFAQRAYFRRAVKADVRGYLLKDSPSSELIDTIRLVQSGGTRFSPELVVNMVTADENPLSKREMDVFNSAASGASTRELAASLFLSEGTVRNYLSAIFSKLGVHGRLEAIEMARRNKWLR